MATEGQFLARASTANPTVATRPGESKNRAFSVTMLWMFGEVAFALLPIITMAIIIAIVKRSFDDFLLIKEWAFATIVLYGVAIRKFMRLKIEVQLAARSQKLDMGVQFYVVLVIFAVVVLVFLILGELKQLAVINSSILEIVQLTLFVISLLSVWMGVWYEENWHGIVRRRSGAYSERWLLRYAKFQIDDAFRQANRLADTLEHLSRLPAHAAEEPMFLRQNAKLKAEMLVAVGQLKVVLATAESSLRPPENPVPPNSR